MIRRQQEVGVSDLEQYAAALLFHLVVLPTAKWYRVGHNIAFNRYLIREAAWVDAGCRIGSVPRPGRMGLWVVRNFGRRGIAIRLNCCDASERAKLAAVYTLNDPLIHRISINWCFRQPRGQVPRVRYEGEYAKLHAEGNESQRGLEGRIPAQETGRSAQREGYVPLHRGNCAGMVLAIGVEKVEKTALSAFTAFTGYSPVRRKLSQADGTAVVQARA